MEQAPLRYRQGVKDRNRTPVPLPVVSSSTSVSDDPRVQIPCPPPFDSQVPPGHTAFRLLFHDSVIRAAYGDAAAAASGHIVIADGTDCKPSGSVARLLDSVPDCDQRVVLVTSPDGGNHEEEGTAPAYSSAQHALLRVYDKLSGVERRLHEENRYKGSGVESTTRGIVHCNMLAPTKLIGSLIGRKGTVIKDIRTSTGTRITVFPSPNLPPCAAPCDELIQISGSALAVRKAIVEVSFHLQVENRKLNGTNLNRGSASPLSFTNLENQRSQVSHKSNAFNTEKRNYSDPAPYKHNHHVQAPVQAPDCDSASSIRNTATTSIRSPAGSEISEEISFRLLCSNDAIGGIMGRAGSIVLAMEKETGASIMVSPPADRSGERVITIRAFENPHSNRSPAQDAVCRVFTRSEKMEADNENGSGPYLNDTGTVTARLLVPWINIGCIIGVGGSIVSEIRRKTSTHINVITGSRVPACSTENDRVVKVSGLFSNVLDALFDITTRLRQDIVSNKNLVHNNLRTESHLTTNLGSYKPAEWPQGGSWTVNHNETIPDDMNGLRLEDDASHSPFSHKFERKISGATLAIREAIIDDDSHPQVENGELDVAYVNHEASSPPSLTNIMDQQTTRFVSNKSHAFNTERPNYAVPTPDKQKCSTSAPDLGTTPSFSGTAVNCVRSSAGSEKVKEISFKLLCSNDTIGGVIGRGGSIVKAMENETGTSILVSPPVRLCDVRVITISASEDPQSNYSPAQDAMCRVFARTLEAIVENRPRPYHDDTRNVTARLLVPYNNIGCIMGFGGSIVSDIRRKTSAHINVITGSLVPACAAENERVVKVSGLFNNVLAALFDITTRLRRDIFANKISIDIAATEFHSAKSFGSYKSAERHRGRSHNANHHATMTDNNGFAGNQGRTSNRDLVVPQETEVQRLSDPFLVTNTTLQISVPADVIGKIYGEGGANLDQIKEISGAEVSVQEPNPGGNEGTVTISGAPDRVFAAKSLLLAFS